MIGTPASLTAEEQRLFESASHEARWRRWGAYLSERQWGTVREDYSADGEPWTYLPFDDARSRAYRWGEDGLLGISDNHQHLCFALALWNGEDPILKDRLFGLSNPEGNHGEDVKECYYFLDGLPTHSLMKALYKYPQTAFPYDRLIKENRERSRAEPEFELIETGIFDESRYFDVTVEYAKASPDDICIEISVTNRGPEQKRLHVLPTLWFRNTWAWGYTGRADSKAQPDDRAPVISVMRESPELAVLEATHPEIGTHFLYAPAASELLFTDNETNWRRIANSANSSPYVKDGFHDYVVEGRTDAINPARTGTKAAPHYVLDIAAGQTAVLRLRLDGAGDLADALGASFDATLTERRRDADEFYARIAPYPQSDEARRIQRTAFAGLLWCQQYYNYVVYQWLDGDPTGPPAPPDRKSGRNHNWVHVYSDDILSMPDNWEYPWFASWDLAFHCITIAMIDPDFAKRQLALLTREWYMHPNGELPAYEWGFGDVNPPVHAWATMRVYQIEQKMFGRTDRLFLERVFQKLLMNFTWWCNRKDAEGNNVFQGGFLGLDNISVFDRSTQLPDGGHLDQADGTAWMGVYCLSMLGIAAELALENKAYEDIASKFFEHFIYIADAINHMGDDNQGVALWDEASGFYYDVLHVPGRMPMQLGVRSMVGLIPLMAVIVSDTETIAKFPDLLQRMNWFIEHRPDLHGNVAPLDQPGIRDRRILAMVDGTKLKKILAKMLDESEFLSPHGIRSLSRYYKEHGYELDIDGMKMTVDYEPAESTSNLFGGNSNWRGPVWFPVNYLIIEALQRFHYYYGDDFKVECPTGSGVLMNLWEVASELSHRLIELFMRDAHGRRPMYGNAELYQTDPHFRDLLYFHEYFNGDTGAGLGAIHQTGWTGIVAKLLQQCAEYCGQEKDPL
jgi:hypothetical protein